MASLTAVAKILVPQIPFLLKTAAFNALSLSPNSAKWDLRTELTVTAIRLFLTHPHPPTITEQQQGSIKDPGVKGGMWVSKVTMPVPDADGEAAVRQLLFEAIREVSERNNKEPEYTAPALLPVEAEWNGYRAGVSANAPEPLGLSEAEKYDNMMKEVTTDVTLLYFHGGALYLQDPCVARTVTAKYAKLTGGRVFSVRYRLAPQNPFPAALLDALVAYLSLLYPPPGALHKPVPASHIVFTGDSAGGNISLCLLQLLLHVHRTNPSGPTVLFHGKHVDLPLPAGLALNSPSIDLTRCMPSTHTNVRYDYLPAPYIDTKIKPPPCDIWPATPPRADLYCEGSMLCHPLVSPLSAKPESWAGAPPTYIVVGEEKLTDEGKVFAQRAARQGAKVVWEQYEAMPHCFALLLEGLGGSNMCFKSWAEFCKTVVQAGPDGIETGGVFVAAKTLERTPVDVCRLMTELSDEEIDRRMRDSQQRMIDFMNE